MNNHKSILSPITKIFEEAVVAVDNTQTSIGAYPIIDYMLHSMFLKATGAVEQKVHSVIMEIAGNDLAVKHDVLSGRYKNNSTLSDKMDIFKELCRQVLFLSGQKMISIDIHAKWADSIEKTIEIFGKSIFESCMFRDFTEFKRIAKDMSLDKCDIDIKDGSNKVSKHFMADATKLAEIYNNYLYNTRNKLAHNITVCDDNLPTIKLLSHEDYSYNNYFLFFTILNFIDKNFIYVYKKYLEIIR